MKRVSLLVLCILVAAALNAEVSDTVLSGLVNRVVEIEKSGGFVWEGTLSSYDDKEVVLIQADGSLVSVDRAEIVSVRVVQATPEKAAAPTAKDRPVSAFALLFDPLGFLQMGPVVELEIRVLPSTLFALTARVEGMGLVYQAIASEGFANTVSPMSMAAGLTLYQLFPGGGMNRVYVVGFAGYGWGSSTGGSGSYAWTSNWGQIEAGGGAGYRWRFESGFFLDLGAVAGLGSNPGTKWYYDDDPTTKFTNAAMVTFIGMLQLHIGWEL